MVSLFRLREPHHSRSYKELASKLGRPITDASVKGCRTPAVAERLPRARGQVSDKPQGRKLRENPRDGLASAAYGDLKVSRWFWRVMIVDR